MAKGMKTAGKAASEGADKYWNQAKAAKAGLKVAGKMAVGKAAPKIK